MDFRKWFRLKEGRQIYRTTFTLYHRDGTPVTVTLEGAHADYVSALANGIKKRYTGEPGESDKKIDDWQDIMNSFLSRFKK